MKVRTIFSEKQPKYRYMILDNGKADVFIYKYIEELKDEDGTVQFAYDMNEFRINVSEISEEMIKDDPESYLDYVPFNGINLEERVNALEDALYELSGVVYNG